MGSICLSVVVSLCMIASASAGSVWPKPQSMDIPEPQGLLALSPKFSFKQTGIVSDTLTKVLQRYAAIIFGASGWIRASSDGFEITRKGAQRAVEITGLILHTLDVSVKYNDEILGADMDESYTLEIVAPTAFLQANSVWGAMRGIETFSQLTAPCARGWVCIKEVTKITDFPRFRYRGALVDSAKHFLPIDVLKQVLDGMAYAKMNVLHWHLSDDESFPFVSEALPFAAEKGAFEDGNNLHMYTKLEVWELIEFARLRGIRVIPEFSTPGHTRSWGKGHPEMLTQCYSAAGEKTSLGPLDPTKASTFVNMRALFDELAHVFPDEYLHVGGDETDLACWKSNPNMTEWMQKEEMRSFKMLENYYMFRLLEVAKTAGRSAVVWQDTFDNKVTLPPRTVVQIWKDCTPPCLGAWTPVGGLKPSDERGRMPDAVETPDKWRTGWRSELDAVTKAGHWAVLSAPWYLNNVYRGWKQQYLVEPLSFLGTADQMKYVLGGTACMWGEWVDATNLVPRMFPRVGAVAERLWSRQDVTDVDDAKTRLERWRCLLVTRGINAEPLSPGTFCKREFAVNYVPAYKKAIIFAQESRSIVQPVVVPNSERP